MNSQLFEELLVLSRKIGRDIGFNKTAVPDFFVVKRQSKGERLTFFNVFIAIVLQGEKYTIFDSQHLEYGPGDCVINSIERPSVTCIKDASPEKPYLSFILQVDRQELLSVASQMKKDFFKSAKATATENRTFIAQPCSDTIAENFLRLARLSTKEVELLGPILKKEIYARVLLSEQGKWLLEVCSLGTHSYQIASVVDLIKKNYLISFNIEELASSVNMSVTTFHRLFKLLTGLSPIQYQKTLRLYEAKNLLCNERLNVSQAAYRVGYLSASQFSNDYRRFFGKAPKYETQ